MKNYNVSYHKKVESDISNAELWYKEKRIGLEKVFLKQIRFAILMIQENPFISQKRYGDIRIVFIKVFPFGIHYTIIDKTKEVYILGIFHTSLDPRKWQERQ